MKTTKVSNFNTFDDTKPEQWARDVDSDLNTVFLCLSGRIRFGPNNTTINKGENILGQFVTYTTNGSANTEDTVPHNLGSVPVGYIVVKQNKSGSVFDSGSTWTVNNLYLKCSGTSVLVTLFLIQ